MSDAAEAAPTPVVPTTKAGQRLIDMLAQIDPEPQGIGWVNDAILAIEAEARSTPAEALDRIATGLGLFLYNRDFHKSHEESVEDARAMIEGWLSPHNREAGE